MQLCTRSYKGIALTPQAGKAVRPCKRDGTLDPLAATGQGRLSTEMLALCEERLASFQDRLLATLWTGPRHRRLAHQWDLEVVGVSRPLPAADLRRWLHESDRAVAT